MSTHAAGDDDPLHFGDLDLGGPHPTTGQFGANAAAYGYNSIDLLGGPVNAPPAGHDAAFGTAQDANLQGSFYEDSSASFMTARSTATAASSVQGGWSQPTTTATSSAAAPGPALGVPVGTAAAPVAQTTHSPLDWAPAPAPSDPFALEAVGPLAARSQAPAAAAAGTQGQHQHASSGSASAFGGDWARPEAPAAPAAGTSSLHAPSWLPSSSSQHQQQQQHQHTPFDAFAPTPFPAVPSTAPSPAPGAAAGAAAVGGVGHSGFVSSGSQQALPTSLGPPLLSYPSLPPPPSGPPPLALPPGPLWAHISVHSPARSGAVPVQGLGAGVALLRGDAPVMYTIDSVVSPAAASRASAGGPLATSLQQQQGSTGSIGGTAGGGTTHRFSVRRRFKDVVALSDMLAALYPGHILPPRPPRNAIGGRRCTPAFIEERRLALERFLNRLACHPVFGSSEVLQVWLTAPAHDLTTALRGQGAGAWAALAQSAQGGGSGAGGSGGVAANTARFLSQLVGRQSAIPTPVELVSSPAGASGAPGQLYRSLHERLAALRGAMAAMPPSPAEQALQEEGSKLEAIQAALTTLSRCAGKLIAKHAELGEAYIGLSRALTALSHYERHSVDIPLPRINPTQLEAAAAAAAKAQGVASSTHTRLTHTLCLPVNEWLAALAPAQQAFAARTRCLLTLATLEQDSAVTQAKLTALTSSGGGGTPATARKAEALRRDLDALSVARTTASGEYQRVSQRNATDLAAMKAQMSRELGSCAANMAAVMATAAQQQEAAWAAAAGELAAAPALH